jgi:hypothetical protein
MTQVFMGMVFKEYIFFIYIYIYNTFVLHELEFFPELQYRLK